MKITILCVGKVKEKYFRDALEEYAKRLSRYCTFEVLEVADEMTPDGASKATEEQIREKEGMRLLDKLSKMSDPFLITMEIEGRTVSSEQLAKLVSNITVRGNSHIVFVIGGSLGLSKAVIQRANEHISFSALTFPHQLMRVILAEQIYRSFRIINGEPYHK